MRVKAPNKTEAIFEATLKLVLREGFTALKMSDVAKEAKVATGTLYIYFKSKEDLINSLYLELKKKSTKAYLKNYNPSEPFMISFEKVWRDYLETNLAQPEATAFMEQYYRSPYLQEAVVNETNQMLKPIFDLLERGKTERLVKDFPTDLLVIQLSGAITELSHWHHSEKLKVTPQIIDYAFALAWDSIKR